MAQSVNRLISHSFGQSNHCPLMCMHTHTHTHTRTHTQNTHHSGLSSNILLISFSLISTYMTKLTLEWVDVISGNFYMREYKKQTIHMIFPISKTILFAWPFLHAMSQRAHGAHRSASITNQQPSQNTRKYSQTIWMKLWEEQLRYSDTRRCC